MYTIRSHDYMNNIHKVTYFSYNFSSEWYYQQYSPVERSSVNFFGLAYIVVMNTVIVVVQIMVLSRHFFQVTYKTDTNTVKTTMRKLNNKYNAVK